MHVTVYLVMGLPPSYVGTVHVTVAFVEEVAEAVAIPIVGASGAVIN